MKNFALIYFYLITCLLISCNNDEVSEIKPELELLSEVTIFETTNKVTDLFFRLGVEGINVERNDGQYVFNPKTFKKFVVDGKNYDFQDFTFILKGETLFIEGNKEFELSILHSKPYLITSNYSGFIDDEKLLSVKNLAISLLFLNELITEEGIKTDFSDHTLLSRGCSISGWRVVGAFGLGESSSEANLAENIDADTDPGGVAEGCRPIGSANTSCVWGSHLCMSTQEYCCD